MPGRLIPNEPFPRPYQDIRHQGHLRIRERIALHGPLRNGSIHYQEHTKGCHGHHIHPKRKTWASPSTCAWPRDINNRTSPQHLRTLRPHPQQAPASEHLLPRRTRLSRLQKHHHHFSLIRKHPRYGQAAHALALHYYPDSILADYHFRSQSSRRSTAVLWFRATRDQTICGFVEFPQLLLT